MQSMGLVEAIKTYFNTNTTRPVENKEILELRKSMTKEDWESMGASCAAALGCELKPA